MSWILSRSLNWTEMQTVALSVWMAFGNSSNSKNVVYALDRHVALAIL